MMCDPGFYLKPIQTMFLFGFILAFTSCAPGEPQQFFTDSDGIQDLLIDHGASNGPGNGIEDPDVGDPDPGEDPVPPSSCDLWVADNDVVEPKPSPAFSTASNVLEPSPKIKIKKASPRKQFCNPVLVPTFQTNDSVVSSVLLPVDEEQLTTDKADLILVPCKKNPHCHSLSADAAIPVN